MRLTGASVVGRAHAAIGLPCQDAHGHLRLPDGGAVLVVADGMGSAPLADCGAKTVVDAVLSSAAQDPAVVEPAALVVSAREALELEAARRGRPISDLATTAIIALWRGDIVEVAHIGDGAAIASVGGRVFVLSPPEPSVYVNETTPLSVPDWQLRLRGSAARNVDAVVLLTDGLQRLALVRSGVDTIPLVGFFQPLLERVHDDTGPADLHQLLSSQRIAQGDPDDKTLLVAVRGGLPP